MDREELAAWLRLASTPGVGRATARRLLAAFGLPHQLFAQPASALASVADAAQVPALHEEPAGWPELVERTWAWLQAAPGTRHVLTLADAAYPAALLNTEDPPLLLYASGRLPHEWPRAVAVVGSRNPTPQGEQNARLFSRGFAQAGLTVVSGLALGIDTAAHEGALEGAATGQLPTIAVVGTGLDRVYPRRNLDLAHRIAAQGLLLSEYPLGTPPLAENFPQRNRIIAALGLGTLVVEAALPSGSLITARQAAEQGRDVFAIPGSIHSPQSRGCHALIRQGAKLVETAQDVLEELGAGPAASPTPPASSGTSVPRRAAPVLDALGFDPSSLDALVARTGMPPSELQAQLLELELAGEVARLPGGLYQRVAQG
jgi:DNA processing protein